MFDWLFGLLMFGCPLKIRFSWLVLVPDWSPNFGLGLAVIRPQLILPFPRIGLKNQITTAT